MFYPTGPQSPAFGVILTAKDSGLGSRWSVRAVTQHPQATGLKLKPSKEKEGRLLWSKGKRAVFEWKQWEGILT